ncbi:MAG: ATP-binding protein [Balneolaceae bacterium]
MGLINESISFGDRRLVGQKQAREQVERLLKSDRLSHAYLFSGKSGAGTTAFALAMAEVVNGIDHFTDLKGTAASRKSSWFTHPDIHVFLPLPSTVGIDELRARLKLLAEDPYEIVDFSLRPALTDSASSKNRRAFYGIDYFHEEIRSKAVLRPNEGRRSILVITGIDTMRKESANAFLKLLEEPADNLLFILTSENSDQLLPTILSRCHQIRLSPLLEEEVKQGLISYDGLNGDDAAYLARISEGDYSLMRFYDIKTIRKNRAEIIQYLRWSYNQDVPSLFKLLQDWQSSLNTESQIALCNTLETLLRDILLYRSTKNKNLITNIDQIETIQKFSESLPNARIDEMIEHLQELKDLLYQNVQFKLIFTALSLRYYYLMRGEEPVIKNSENWKHLPAFTN